MFDDVLQVHVIDIFIGHVVDVIRNLPIDVMMGLEYAVALGGRSHYNGARDGWCRQTGMTIGALAFVSRDRRLTVCIVVACRRRRNCQDVLGNYGIASLTVFLNKELTADSLFYFIFLLDFIFIAIVT